MTEPRCDVRIHTVHTQQPQHARKELRIVELCDLETDAQFDPKSTQRCVPVSACRRDEVLCMLKVPLKTALASGYGVAAVSGGGFVERGEAVLQVTVRLYFRDLNAVG